MSIKTLYRFTCDDCGRSIDEYQSVVGMNPFIYANETWGWKMKNDGVSFICKSCLIKQDKKAQEKIVEVTE